MSHTGCDKRTRVIFCLCNGCTLVWHRSLFGSVLVAQWSDISHFLVVYWLPCGHSLVVSRSRFLVVTTLLRVYRMTLWQRHFPTLLWPKNDVVTTLWQRWNVCWEMPNMHECYTVMRRQGAGFKSMTLQMTQARAWIQTHDTATGSHHWANLAHLASHVLLDVLSLSLYCNDRWQSFTSHWP